MRSRNNRTRKWKTLMSVLVPSLALTACGVSTPMALAPAFGVEEVPPPLAHAGQVTVHTTAFQHEVSFPFEKSKLSIGAAQRLDSFLAQSRVGYGDRLQIVYRPISGAAHSVRLASKRGRMVAAHLSRYPIPLELVSDVPSAKGRGRVSVVVIRHVAFARSCREWRQGVVKGRFVDQVSPLGCLNDKALAAMIANPADLVDPGPMGPANGVAQGRSMILYRAGRTPKAPSTTTSSSTNTVSR